MKVAVIGAGSTYTPELVNGLWDQRERLPVKDLWLMDPDESRLSVVGGLVQRMLAAQGSDTAIRLTGSRSDALDGADAVLVQLRVGGQKARLEDETRPLACGCIGQETTGAGGLAKAMRTVPVVLDIADEARRRAHPDAWIVDFTNPVGIVTRALLDAGHKAIGLCNFAIGVQRWVADLLGVHFTRVEVDQVGLNHLSWVRHLYVDGTDVLPDLLATRIDDVSRQMRYPPSLLRELGVIPSYYLSYYYRHDLTLAEQRESTPRAAVVAEIEARLLSLYTDPNLISKPAELDKRGGAYYSEAATALLASVVAGDGEAHVVNVRNNGTIRGLADDDVIETRCLIDSASVIPVPQADVPPEILGLVQHVSAYERLAARAAVDGDHALLRRAMLAHPLIGQLDRIDALDEAMFGGYADG